MDEYEYEIIIKQFDGGKGSLSAEDVFDILTKQPKPWQTKWWKEKRLKYLKKFCETCGCSGDNKNPLVLQHTIQPRKYNDIHSEVSRKYIDYQKIYEKEFKKVKQLHVDKYLNKIGVKRNCCPRCKSVNIRYVRTDNTYICEYRRRGGKACHYKFTTPIKDVIYYPSYQTTRIDSSIINQVKHKIAWTKAKNKNDTAYLKHRTQIFNETIAISLNEGLIYRRFDHVKTLCRKCSFKEDLHIIRRKQNF